MYELPAVQSAPNRPARRRLNGERSKPGVEQLERRELLDTGLGSTLGLVSTGSNRLISAVYNDVLKRAPQPAELAQWQSALTAGESMSDVARAFLASPEYQTEYIRDTYSTVLKREALPQEVTGWLQATQAGLSEERLTAQFLASDEYYEAKGGTAETWLTGLYWDLFQRAPDATGFFLWREGLQNGASRETVALGFVASQEENTRFVTASYEQLLGRAPDSAGQAVWVAELDGGAQGSDVTAAIIGSPEYASMHISSSPVTNAAGVPWRGEVIATTAPPVSPWNPGSVGGTPPGAPTSNSAGKVVVSAGADITAKEGTPLQFAGTVSGGKSPYTYVWDFGDGTQTSGSLTPTHAYANSGTYTVTLTATDNLNRVGQSTLRATVQDVPPTVTINGAPTSWPTGMRVSLTSTVTSPSPADMAASFTYAWSVTKDGALYASATTPNLVFNPTTAGAYLVTLTVTDKDKATGTATTTISVSGSISNPPTSNPPTTNPPPSDPPTSSPPPSNPPTSDPLAATINGAPASSPEGRPVTLTGTITSANAADMAAGFSYAWSVTDNGTAFSSGTAATFSFTPLEHGTYVVTLVATAQDKTTGTATQTITVTDAPPLVSISGAPTAGQVGTAIALTSNVYSPSPTDTAAGFSYSWSVTKNGTAFASGTTANFSFTPDSQGTYAVTFAATDRDGAIGKDTKTITVTARNLTVNPPTLADAIVNSAYSATLSATGGSGSYTFAVSSGSLPSWLSLNTNTGVLSGTPTSAGTSTFTITASDNATSGLTGSQAYTLTVNPASNSTAEPLLHQSNLQYIGAFRVPAVSDPLGSGDYTFSYGGTALAFNPANHSLFIVGMPYEQAISEISIPQSIINSTNLNNLATATVLQGPVEVLPKLPSNPLAGGTGGVDIGGLTVDNGQLIGTAYISYDAAGSAVVSHFNLSSLNLSSAQVGGLYQVGNLGAGLVAGYMAPIPSEWQAALGAPYLTGQADINIISRTSSGPGAFGFDPTTLGSGVAPITPYVYYPLATPLGPLTGPADPLQSETAQVNGVLFAPGTSSVLFFGTTGTNLEGYGLASTYGDNSRIYKGPHSLNGEYAFQVWAYNANDFAAVHQGQLQPWQVQPYDVWNFTLPNVTAAGNRIGGVAYDAGTGRVYVSVLNADNQTPYSSLPLIEVFQLTTSQPSASTPLAPEIGTLAATPSTEAPGPVPQGTSVTLTAGNVYAISNGASVTQVAFYLDSNNDGVLETGADKLLGYGTPSTIPNAGHNSILTISTAGLSPGTYTLFAQALDSNGLLSNPIATTVTIQ